MQERLAFACIHNALDPAADRFGQKIHQRFLVDESFGVFQVIQGAKNAPVVTGAGRTDLNVDRVYILPLQPLVNTGDVVD